MVWTESASKPKANYYHGKLHDINAIIIIVRMKSCGVLNILINSISLNSIANGENLFSI